MDTLLSYEHVDICYNGIPAVRDVSFQLHKGEILGVVGESGSGKSTLIRAAVGLLGSEGMVTRGDIWYEGKDLPDLSRQDQRALNGAGIGMIFQNPGASFCPVRKIADQLYEALRAHETVSKRDFHTRACDLMRRTGLDDPDRVLNSYPFELSGGMQQRAGIVAAMLLQPAVLLADEPTSALDSMVQKQVVNQLMEIRNTFGTSILIVSHNIGVIRAMADHVLVMKDGEMVEYGPCGQVMAHPRQAYTKELIEAVPVLRQE